MRQFRKLGEGKLAAIARLAAAILLLPGCAQSAAPVTSPYHVGPASTPDVAGAGSFPRSFLIPGSDTSIRIGG